MAILALTPAVVTIAMLSFARFDHDVVSGRWRAPAPRPPSRDSDPGLVALVAVLQHTGRGDALVIGDRRFTAVGAAKGLKPSTYRPTPTNVMLGGDGARVAFPAFGTSSGTGSLVVATGVALREDAMPRATAAGMSLAVPCATTWLARDQFAYVYLGGFARARGGVARLTEIGLQMNPPPGGGIPRSVQIYARRETAHGTVATGTGVHLRCNAAVAVRFAPIGRNVEAATFIGPAIPLRSHRITIVERLDAGEDVFATGHPFERVTALAVAANSGPVRRGSRLGEVDGSREPRLVFGHDRDFVSVAPSHDALVNHVREADRTRVGIDERYVR